MPYIIKGPRKLTVSIKRDVHHAALPWPALPPSVRYRKRMRKKDGVVELEEALAKAGCVISGLYISFTKDQTLSRVGRNLSRPILRDDSSSNVDLKT